MIIPNLKGGLGNQMFQIAAAYGAAKNNNTDYGIDLSLQHHGGQGHSHSKYADNFFKNVKRAKHDDTFVKYDEPHFSYAEINTNTNLLIDGYFQSDKYFSHCADDIRNLFNFDQETKDDVSKKCVKIKEAFEVDELVCIHVRRGEYLLPGYNSVHITMPVTYYKNAMDLFPNCGFVVISDDMNWCQNNLNGDKIAFCNSGYDFFTQPITTDFNELFDMYLAIHCEHNIMSPSSFSWWGAWLGSSSKVVAPAPWFGAGGPPDYQDIYCDNWVITG